MLPELKIYTTEEDIKYILFEQKEVISDEIKTSGVFNRLCIDVADTILMKSQPGHCVIDIGSGIGTFTIPLAIKHANAFNFHAFEPISTIAHQLSTNILLNNLDNVRSYNVGISNFDGITEGPALDIRNCENHGSLSFFRVVNESRNMPTDMLSLYEFKRLDFYSFKKVAFIKISVNGMEIEVLNSAKETIQKNNNPPLLIQLWSNDFNTENKESVLKLLETLGYRHFCSFGEHYLCCSSQLEYEYLTTPIPSASDFGDFSVVEEQHDTEEALRSQQPLK